MTIQQSPLWQKLAAGAMAALLASMVFVGNVIVRALENQNRALTAQNRELGEVRTLLEGYQTVVNAHNTEAERIFRGLERRLREMEREHPLRPYLPEE